MVLTMYKKKTNNDWNNDWNNDRKNNNNNNNNKNERMRIQVQNLETDVYEH
jgi:hypothetical protein